MAKVSELFEAPRAAYYAKVLELVKAEFKKHPSVTNVQVKSSTSWNGLCVLVAFEFGGARVVAAVSDSSIRNGEWDEYSRNPIDIRIDRNACESIAEYLSDISTKYRDFLKVKVERIRVEALNGEVYNRKQRLFLTQQLFLDEGFEATAKIMPSGQMRLVITHQLLPGPLREVIVD